MVLAIRSRKVNDSMAKSVDVRYSPRMVHHRSAYRVLVTDEDAAALVFTCLMALKFDHKFRGDSPAQQVPNGLLRQALAHIEERLGTQATAKIRADLASYGVDHSDLSGAESPVEQASCADSDSANIEGPQPSRRTPWNLVPVPIADAVRAKHREGWSKSRISREFRLNRRTVIRICANQ
jgi:hypothetical protein